MKLSARNVLKGRVVKVIRGQTTAHVKIDVGGGSVVTASITVEAVDELGLREGDAAYAVIKASDVIVADEADSDANGRGPLRSTAAERAPALRASRVTRRPREADVGCGWPERTHRVVDAVANLRETLDHQPSGFSQHGPARGPLAGPRLRQRCAECRLRTPQVSPGVAIGPADLTSAASNEPCSSMPSNRRRPPSPITKCPSRSSHTLVLTAVSGKPALSSAVGVAEAGFTGLVGFTPWMIARIIAGPGSGRAPRPSVEADNDSGAAIGDVAYRCSGHRTSIVARTSESVLAVASASPCSRIPGVSPDTSERPAAVHPCRRAGHAAQRGGRDPAGLRARAPAISRPGADRPADDPAARASADGDRVLPHRAARTSWLARRAGVPG